MYWFKFILRLLFKLLVLGQEIQDARQLDEDEEFDCDESKEKDVATHPAKSKDPSNLRLRKIK